MASARAFDRDIVDPATDLHDISIDRFYKMAEVRSCKTQYCRALYNVSYALEWLQRRDVPNSLARTVPLPESYLVDYTRRAAYLVASRRDATMNCFVVQKIARDPVLRFDNHLGFVELMEIVSKLPAGSGTRRRGIVAAMPQTPATTKLLKNADEFVKAQVHVHPTSRP